MERRSILMKEDIAISKLVSEFGTREWTLLSRKLSEIYGITGRTGKQCRERWINHIDPQVSQSDIIEDEEELLFAAYKKHGTKWAEIAKEMPGRTDNIVKNHFYSIIRKQFRRIRKAAKIKINFAEDLTIQHLLNLLKEYQLPLSILSNKHIIQEISVLEGQENLNNPDNKSSTKVSSLFKLSLLALKKKKKIISLIPRYYAT